MVRLTDRPDMTLDVYRGRKTTMQQQPATISRVDHARYEVPYVQELGTCIWDRVTIQRCVLLGSMLYAQLERT